jgi:hypothetical protein
MSSTDAVGGTLLRLRRLGGTSMHTIAIIGLDIAKLVFQAHGVDVLAFFQKLPPCLVDIETWNNGGLAV